MERFSRGASTIKQIILGVFMTLLVMGGIFVTKLIWFQPFSIDHFYNRVFIGFAAFLRRADNVPENSQSDSPLSPALLYFS